LARSGADCRFDQPEQERKDRKTDRLTLIYYKEHFSTPLVKREREGSWKDGKLVDGTAKWIYRTGPVVEITVKNGVAVERVISQKEIGLITITTDQDPNQVFESLPPFIGAPLHSH